MEEQHSQAAGPAVDELLSQARAWADRAGLTQRVEQSPWLMFAGALAAGYLIGRVAGDAAPGGLGSSLAGGVLSGIGVPTGGHGRPMRTSDFAHRHTGAGHMGVTTGTGR